MQNTQILCAVMLDTKGVCRENSWGMVGAEASPAFLFQLYVDYGRYAEATNLLLDYIEPIASVVHIPVVQVKKKLEDGSISVKPKFLFKGCIFLNCILNKQVHDLVLECDGVKGFIAVKVGNIKRQI